MTPQPAKPIKAKGRAKSRHLRNLPDPSFYDDAQLIAELQQLQAEIDREKYNWRCDRTNCDGLPHEGYLHRHARGTQHTPPGMWLIWLILAGRGYGKTRTGSETSREWGEAEPLSIAVVAKKDTLCRDICFEGPAGLRNVIPPDLQAHYTRGSGSITLTLTNGTVFRGFSSEEPDNLRGFAFDRVWCDEYAAWKPQNALDVLANALFCLRESIDPRIILTTTPQAVAQVVELVNEAAKQPDGPEGLTRITRGHTDENRANLSQVAIKLIYGRFEGTRLGRQELGGELLTDVEGAIWRQTWIDSHLVFEDELPDMAHVVVAIDPAVTVTEDSDETGIVAAGRGVDGYDYVLADRSGKVVGTPAARRAWLLWAELEADEMVYEDNQGNEWVGQVLSDVWYLMQKEGILPGGSPPLKKVHAKRNKRLRAEPVASRYEQGRVYHVRRMSKDGTILNDLARLEEQQVQWVPGDGGDSPDRLDAGVYALIRLRGTEGLAAEMDLPSDSISQPRSVAAMVAEAAAGLIGSPLAGAAADPRQPAPLPARRIRRGGPGGS